MRKKIEKPDKQHWPNVILRNIDPLIWRETRSKAVLERFTMGQLVNAWAKAWVDGRINIPIKEKK